MQRKAKNICRQYSPAYALHPGTFREEQVYRGKEPYYFLCDDGRFSNPDYRFFLQTQLLAHNLLRGMDGYVFYVQILVEAIHRIALEEFLALACWKEEKDIEFLSYKNLDPQLLLQEFSFFTRNLNAISQNTALIVERAPVEVTSIYADYYAIKASALVNETSRKSSFSSIKDEAEIALISDDTHSVWTILRTEKYPQNLLTENLRTFCDTYSAKLNIYP